MPSFRQIVVEEAEEKDHEGLVKMGRDEADWVRRYADVAPEDECREINLVLNVYIQVARRRGDEDAVRQLEESLAECKRNRAFRKAII